MAEALVPSVALPIPHEVIVETATSHPRYLLYTSVKPTFGCTTRIPDTQRGISPFPHVTSRRYLVARVLRHAALTSVSANSGVRNLSRARRKDVPTTW